MPWTLKPASESFPRHRDQWNELNRALGDHILLDSFFVEALIRNFAAKDVLLAVSPKASGPALALLARGNRYYWQTFQPSQAPLGLILAEKDGVPEERILELIRLLPGYNLGFGVLQQDPDYSSFGNPERFRNSRVLDYIQTSRLRISGTFEDYWRARGKNLKHNLERQGRRLKDKGDTLELLEERDPGQVSRILQEYGTMEASGWKGRVGTAVTPLNSQGKFYREVFEEALRRGEGVIYRLAVNGRTTACDLCLERRGMMIVLKTAYDEECIPGISPSLLMRQEIVKSLYSGGRIKVVEFYGRVRDWHRKWTDEVRNMYHVNIYRNAWIALAHQALSKLKGSIAGGVHD